VAGWEKLMSSDHETTPSGTPTVASFLERDAGVRVAECYQCGKCTAGCPAASEMDHPPSVVLRLLQMEMPSSDARVLASKAIWMCVGCETCVTRCPNEVNLPRVMDALRQKAAELEVAHADARDIMAFHHSFLDSVESHGRLYELGFLVDYKLRTGHLLQDMLLAPPTFAKGKMGLLPHRLPAQETVARIFERARALKKETGT
jgi:heterodisulfide reductase subunit C2